MFRREKETRLDSEGRRRMREAIRQRLEQDDDAAPDADETDETQYAQATAPAGGADYTQVAPFDPEELGGYGQRRDEGFSSYLTAGRQDRTLPSFETPAIPARSEPIAQGAPAWTPAPAEPVAAPTPSWTPAGLEPASAPEAPARPAATTVAADTTWRGTLRSSGALQIDGSFEGQIDTEQNLTISADARVEATVRAGSITVAGQLSGQITCQERLEILPTGRVSGQIDAGRFVVHEGAFLGGQVRMTSAASADEGGRPMLQRVR